MNNLTDDQIDSLADFAAKKALAFSARVLVAILDSIEPDYITKEDVKKIIKNRIKYLKEEGA